MSDAQESKPKYLPNQIQSLQLKVAQQKAQIAQKDLFIAQQNFQAALSELEQAGDKVKTENSWDRGVVFNPETLAFIDGPKLVPTKDEKKSKGDEK